MFTVTGGPLEAPDGTPLDGVSLLFTPSLSRVLPGGGKVTVGAGSGKVVAGVLKAHDGVAAMQLEWGPGLQYLVQMVAATGGFVSSWTPFWFNVPPADGGTVDLATVVPVSVPSGQAGINDLISKINRQAFAGGQYDIGGYGAFTQGDHAVAPSPVVVAGLSDVQGLASGGWNMTGKGGLYRLSIYAYTYVQRALIAGERADLSLSIKRVDTGANIFGDTWSITAVGATALSDNQHPASFIYIADNAGVISWTINVGVTSQTVPALVESVDLTVDLQRVAGYPV